MGFARVLCALALLFACLFPALTSEASHARKRVLYISSYHPAFPSFFPQIEGVREALAETVDESELMFDIEFMDAKRFNPQTQVPIFVEGLRRKLEQIAPYDVVIVADDDAFRMAIAEQAGLFRGAPVIFLAVNDRPMAIQQNLNPRVTGVIEATSLEANLKAIEHLYPVSGRIVVIVDNTPVGEIARTEAAKAASILHRHRLEFLSLAEMDFAGLLGRLAALPSDVPVLLLSAYRDQAGASREFLDVLGAMRTAYQGAIFSRQSHGIGQGVLGGEIVDHRRQGRAAGELAGQILTGTPVSSLPVIEKSPNALLFDYAEARRIGLARNRFPAGSEFINLPLESFGRYREIILAAGVLALVQGIVIVLLVRNVRRRREAERIAQRARTDAELANKTKTEFLANMSHELRTPLNSVIGFADVMIADRVGAIGPEKRAEYLSDIRESGQHLLDLINNILDVAKIEMGKLQIADAEIDVGQALKLCARLVAERAAANNTRLELVLADDLPRLSADPTRLKQSVLNLLSNAIKFSEGGGTIVLSAGLDDRCGIVIAVRDDGPGIPADEIAIVMRPFSRGRDSRIAAKEGSGIGLALTASLMESHGGSLTLDSEAGVGTTATLRFPPERTLLPRAARTAAGF